MRLLSDTRHVWTEIGRGFTLDNLKEDPQQTNVLHAFAKGDPAGKSADACKEKCEGFDACRFISVDASAETCILYKRANTVKAKKHTKEELRERFGVTARVQSWQKDAALVPLQPDPDYEQIAKDLDAASTCDGSLDEGEESGDDDANKDPSGSGALSFLKRSAFTASVQGRVTLAMRLGSISFGMIDFELTLSVAAALRKGNVPNQGVYFSLDMSGKGRARASKALQDFSRRASTTVNGACDSVREAMDSVRVGKSERPSIPED